MDAPVLDVPVLGAPVTGPFVADTRYDFKLDGDVGTRTVHVVIKDGAKGAFDFDVWVEGKEKPVQKQIQGVIAGTTARLMEITVEGIQGAKDLGGLATLLLYIFACYSEAKGASDIEVFSPARSAAIFYHKMGFDVRQNAVDAYDLLLPAYDDAVNNASVAFQNHQKNLLAAMKRVKEYDEAYKKKGMFDKLISSEPQQIKTDKLAIANSGGITQGLAENIDRASTRRRLFSKDKDITLALVDENWDYFREKGYIKGEATRLSRQQIEDLSKKHIVSAGTYKATVVKIKTVTKSRIGSWKRFDV